MMKKILQICLLISLVFVANETKAQDVTAKDILAQAAEAKLDKENFATAKGTGIQGRFTTVKMSKGQNADLRGGFYAGILELAVNGDKYENLKSGKFNLFFKDGKEGLKLYMEEKGNISNVFDATEIASENGKDPKMSDKPMLNFPEQLSKGKLSIKFNQNFNRPIDAITSFDVFSKPKVWFVLCFFRTCVRISSGN